MKRRAFTVIELMVVIGIIALLAGLLVMGVNKMQQSAKRRQTEQILENCRSMFAEFDAAKRPHYQPPDAASATPVPCPQNVTADLYKPPGTINDRFGTAVVISNAFMTQFRAMPVNAAALGKLSAESVTRLPGTLPNPSPWTSGSNYKAFDLSSGRVYDPTDPGNARYICILSHISSTANQPPNPIYWIPEPTDNNTPVILDGWGNPVIFVPWGLGADIVWSSPNPVPAGVLVVAGDRGIVMTAAGPIAPKLNARPIEVGRPSRPFFGSAGPDGDFSKGDDNLYSFEK